MSDNVAKTLIRLAWQDNFRDRRRLIISEALALYPQLTEEELLQTLREYLAQAHPNYRLRQASANIILFEPKEFARLEEEE